MKHTIYHLHYRSLALLEAISKETNHEALVDLKKGLGKLCCLLSNNDFNVALEFREIALMLHAQKSFLLKRQQQRLLSTVCIALVLLAQKQENLSDANYLQTFQKKIEPIQSDSHLFETHVLRLLSQQCSLFLSGHDGICAIAAKEWLAGNFMAENRQVSGSNFVERVAFRKQELCYLYAREEERSQTALMFFLVSGPQWQIHGALMIALLDALSKNKPTLFFIKLVHLKKQLVHSVGCKYDLERIQWFDSDCGIFESHDKKKFVPWLDFYLEKNQYKEKFSFFSVYVAERSPTLGRMVENGVDFARHFIG